MTAEALALYPSDIAFLKARVPADLVDAAVNDGEFRIIDEKVDENDGSIENKV